MVISQDSVPRFRTMEQHPLVVSTLGITELDRQRDSVDLVSPLLLSCPAAHTAPHVRVELRNAVYHEGDPAAPSIVILVGQSSMRAVDEMNSAQQLS